MHHHHLQYVEFASPDLEATRKFYKTVFNWKFESWGEEYISFSGKYVDGGFFLGEVKSGSTLPVIYSDDLKGSRDNIKAAGGSITKEIFSFPGGQRFHFNDTTGNELAVWTEIKS